ncbi:MAG: hypothetical protein OEV64_01900 [Desulfobulbaceae bacterium]|nr:hypothetical protein [Desulfobulbaceae bacterium]
MKVTYFKYWILHKENRYRFSILPLLKAFANYNNPEFKKLFTSKSDENLFLFPVKNKIFLFTIVKDNEIVKAINANDLSHEDIHKRLSDDEQLGFASYLYIDDHYYGIASTFFGPKNTYWTDFVNDLFQKLNIHGCWLESAPFPVEASRNEALQLDFKGSTYIEINNQNTIWTQLKSLLCIDNDVNTISLSFKPQRRKEMRVSVDNIINNLEDTGLQKYIIKGKKTIEDSLTDFYIVGSGHISDSIIAKEETEICHALLDKIKRNTLLSNSLEAFKNDTAYLTTSFDAITIYHDPDDWDLFL